MLKQSQDTNKKWLHSLQNFRIKTEKFTGADHDKEIKYTLETNGPVKLKLDNLYT